MIGNSERGVLRPEIKHWAGHLREGKNSIFSKKESHFLAILRWPFQCIKGRKGPG